MYIELHTASAFSFLEGASLPDTLVERAAALGYSTLALVDRDGVYGAPRFHKAALKAGIRPIIGCELTMTEAGDRSQNAESRLALGPAPGRRTLSEQRISPRVEGPNPESRIPRTSA